MLDWSTTITRRPVCVIDLLHFPALLAIECELAEPPPLPTLERAAAERFGALLATDLARFVPAIESFDLVCAAAVYDQAQVLRPGWPVHASLGALHTSLGAGDRGGRVISIGSHAGKMPAAALDPDPRLHGSALLLMPWLLRGERELVGVIGAALERDLLETGMASPEFALDLRALLGFPIRHVRHMTLYDLCALTCAQYEHAGLGGVWQIIEAALLKPDDDQQATLEDGSSLHYRDGVVRSDSRDRRRIAQCRAILAAHGVELIDATTTH